MEQDIYEILGKYFRKEITPDEKEYLDQWLISKDNQLVFNEVEKVWELTGKLDFTVKPDVDNEWKRFQNLKHNPSALNYLEKGKTYKLNNFTFWGYRIAATLLIGVSIFAAIKILKTTQLSDDLISISSGEYRKELILPDGSKVTLNNYSLIEYKKQFTQKERQVNLKGEAYFEVIKGKGSFTVQTFNTKTIVLGTKFNLKAIPDLATTELYVTEGKVMFSSIKTEKKDIFTNGDKGIYNNNSDSLIHERTNDPNIIAWKTDELTFDNRPLSDVQKTISEYFGKTVILEPKLKELKYTGSFNHPQLEDLLDILSASAGIKYKIVGDSVILMQHN